MKQVLLILMLSFGITSVAYAQEPVSTTDVQVRDVRMVGPDRVKIKDMRQKSLETRKQALDIRAEKKAELTAEAKAAKEDFRAQFKAATTTEAQAAVRADAAAKRAQLQDTAKNYRDEWRERVKGFFKNRIEVIFTQFNMFINKAQAADTRVQAVLDKLEARGIDGSSVQAPLDEARALIVSIQERMRTIRVNLEAAVESGSKEEVRAAFNKAKEEIKTAQRELKAVYANIREAIAELRKLVKNEKDGAERDRLQNAENEEETGITDEV